MIWTFQAINSSCPIETPNIFNLCIAIIGFHILIFCIIISVCFGGCLVLLVRVSTINAGQNSNKGATKKEIEKNSKVVKFDKSLFEEDAQCSVCLCEFEKGDKIRTLNCNHFYHRDCIDKWLKTNSKCPLCVQSIQKPEEEIIEEN
eukprot:TRINITY_DN2568_c0_g1_i2.p2 TRINITY_DN2568_c0_g1~~TRINITY_DN2568_c0_g1_i2.p2  ORF type:complete len:146 (-),score=27.89 TRINITY_DN2568_c0_g1_i2:6-443(-)